MERIGIEPATHCLQSRLRLLTVAYPRSFASKVTLPRSPALARAYPECDDPCDDAATRGLPTPVLARECARMIIRLSR